VDKKGLAFKVYVMGLAATVMVAREEIERAERFARALVERKAAAHLYLALITSSLLKADALSASGRIRYFSGP
jgi:hypothetical protein